MTKYFRRSVFYRSLIFKLIFSLCWLCATITQFLYLHSKFWMSAANWVTFGEKRYYFALWLCPYNGPKLPRKKSLMFSTSRHLMGTFCTANKLFSIICQVVGHGVKMFVTESWGGGGNGATFGDVSLELRASWQQWDRIIRAPPGGPK